MSGYERVTLALVSLLALGTAYVGYQAALEIDRGGW